MGNHKIIIASGAETVRYSMYDFIDFVREQSVIWDRSHEAFRIRERRQEGWQEVARKLYPNFDNISEAEKNNIVMTLTKRWKNTRDSYFKSCRNSSLNPGGSHNYIYQNELNFLREYGNESNSKTEKPKLIATNSVFKRKTRSAKFAKRKHRTHIKTLHNYVSPSMSQVSELDPLCSDIEDLTKNDEKDEITSTPTNQEMNVEFKHEETISSRGGPQSSLQVSQIQPTETIRMCVDSTTDSDQAFFDSIKPVVRNMTVDQKLDFQIDVLKLLKNFRSS